MMIGNRMSERKPTGFTGRHMAMILVGFFAVVVAVNLTMARLAGATFGGVVVENSYVASQHFNHWLDEAERGRALGWDARLDRAPDGRLRVALAGVPQGAVQVAATVWHPLGRQPDRELAFVRQADGQWLSQGMLPEGRWIVRLDVRAQGQVWRHQVEV